jgi:hypothetical protein
MGSVGSDDPGDEKRGRGGEEEIREIGAREERSEGPEMWEEKPGTWEGR